MFISCRNYSIVELIHRTASGKGSESNFTFIAFDSMDHCKIKYVPAKYDNDILFELLPLLEGIPIPYKGIIEGMGKQFDVHAWCKTMTMNIKNDFASSLKRPPVWGTFNV